MKVRFPSYVRTGTLADMQATTGYAGLLFFNTTYQALFSWTYDRWVLVSVDSRYGFSLYDDWLSGNSISAFAWTVSGTQVYNAAITDVNPGTMTIRQATAGSVSTVRSSLTNIQLGTMDFYWECIVQIPTLATVAEDFSVALGLHDNASYSATSSCTDGVWFGYDRATSGDFWVSHTTSNGTDTATTTAQAIVAGTFYRLGFYVNASSSVKFYVDGTLLATHSTNIPTGASRVTGYNFALSKTAGTGNSDMAMDSVRSYGFFNSRRAS